LLDKINALSEVSHPVIGKEYP